MVPPKTTERPPRRAQPGRYMPPSRMPGNKKRRGPDPRYRSSQSNDRSRTPGRPSGPRQRPQQRPEGQKVIQTPRGDKVTVTPLGGMEEVGLNMMVFEYVPVSGNPDIVIVDMGLQFPEEGQPGIDYMIPNTISLKGREKFIRGVIITHGHYDHIGGIPHLTKQLGNPMIYGTRFTNAIIRKRQDDFRDAPLSITDISVDEKIQMGRLTIEFVHINHSIPGSVAVVLHTPAGTFIHTGDWKLDLTPASEPIADLAKFASLGNAGVTALLGDSTNAWIPGHQISEQDIGEALRTVVEKAPGRIIIGSFASLLSRVEQIIRIAMENDRKIAVDGYSMKTNVEIAKQMQYIKAPQSAFIDINDVNKYDPKKVLIMCTGAQGEGRAVLMRIANGEHRSVQIEPGDTVVFSSSVVPGNERTVQRLQDTLYRKGARVIHKDWMDVHAGGHAKSEDVKLLLNLVRPKYYIPIEGNHFMLKLNGENAVKMGMPKENIFIADDGQVMEFWKQNDGIVGALTNRRVPTEAIMVDGLGVGDVSEVVLRDRQHLSEDGMVVVIATVAKKTGQLVGNPDIISRGFVFLKENKKMIDDVRALVKKIVKDPDPKSQADEYYIKNKIRDDIGKLILQKTNRHPMILPVVIEV